MVLFTLGFILKNFSLLNISNYPIIHGTMHQGKEYTLDGLVEDV